MFHSLLVKIGNAALKSDEGFSWHEIVSVVPYPCVTTHAPDRWENALVESHPGSKGRNGLLCGTESDTKMCVHLKPGHHRVHVEK